MENSFFTYLELLELMIFFSGYTLIYFLIRVVAETGFVKRLFKTNISFLLPYAYALAGMLYLGLQLKTLFPDYSMEHIRLSMQVPLLKTWALLSILFIIPAFAKKPFFSLLHSLVFFFFLVRDLGLNIFKGSDGSVLKNDMNIYTYSLLINMAAFVFVLLVYNLFNKLRKNKAGQNG